MTDRTGKKRKLDEAHIKDEETKAIPKRGRPYKSPREEFCTCFESHESKLQCLEEEKSRHCNNVTGSIVNTSPMITVFVGTDDALESFSVHEDILSLQSKYLQNQIRDTADLEDRKIMLPNVNPFLFQDFVTWSYTGNFTSWNVDVKMVGDKGGIDLWAMAKFLQAPAFQNFCMDDFRIWCKTADEWPCIDDIRYIYKVTSKESLFRKFAAHSMMRKHPLATYKEGTKKFKEWKAFMQECTDLVLDMAIMGGVNWDSTYPWDDIHREKYMELELPVKERWDQVILAEKTKEEILEAATKGCRVSKIKKEHLERK